MSHSRRQGNTLLISIAVFGLFALSNVLAEPADSAIPQIEPAGYDAQPRSLTPTDVDLWIR